MNRSSNVGEIIGPSPHIGRSKIWNTMMKIKVLQLCIWIKISCMEKQCHKKCSKMVSNRLIYASSLKNFIKNMFDISWELTLNIVNIWVHHVINYHFFLTNTKINKHEIFACNLNDKKTVLYWSKLWNKS